MSDWQLTAPALLAHVFLGRSDDMRAPTQRLVSVWDNVTARFGLGDSIPALRVPARLIRGNPIAPGQTGLVAAAESGERSVWQACAWAGHGVLGVSVMMAPPRERDCREEWAGLEHGWEEVLAASPDEGVLGEARLFLALLTGRQDGERRYPPDTPGPAVNLIRAAAPEPSAPGWWGRWDTVPLEQPDAGEPDAVLIWEVGPEAADGRASRRLACVAPAPSERLADRFLWTAGDGAPSPLTRHLAHASGLRYQVRVYDGGARSRQLRDEIGQLVDHLPATTAGVSNTSAATGGPDSPLLEARAVAISLRRRLTAMRHAVDILDRNLRQALPSPGSGPGSGPLADDRDLAAWFKRQLDDEIALVDEATASAEAATVLLADAGGRESPTRPAARPGAGSRAFAPRVPVAQGPFLSIARPRPGARRVVVVTALGVEYQAIREYLGADAERREENGTLYEIGTLPGVSGSWQVALAEAGPGSTAAGLQLDRAARAIDPEIAIFLGVAGGRKDVKLGDEVAADTIYDYEWGKSTLEGFEPRMRTHSPAHRLLQWARLVARESKWQRRILPNCPHPPPAAYVKPIVTGGKVVAHDRSEVALLLNRYASDAVAVETEGHGFLEAAYVNPRVDALVIRGISDMLTGKDKRNDDYWQPVASRHAAAFAIEFLNSIGGNET